MANDYRATKDRTVSKAKAAGLLAAASLLAASLGMASARADENNNGNKGLQSHGSGGGAGKVSNQIKYQSNQYKEDSNQYKEDADQASPKLNSTTGRALNPQPLPPGRTQ